MKIDTRTTHVQITSIANDIMTMMEFVNSAKGILKEIDEYQKDEYNYDSDKSYST